MHPEAISRTPASVLSGLSGSYLQGLIVRLAIFSAFAAMLVMVWTRNVNWDEFYFLSHVHAHISGNLDRPLQTFFVHGFGWLASVPGQEMEQIAAARVVMMGFFTATCISLHRIAATLADEPSADIALLAFLTSGFVMAHGGSFRADPMAAGLLTTALALMMTTRMGPVHMAALAALSALALLVTVKSALYLPVFMAALVWRWQDKAVVLRSIIAGLFALVLAVVLFTWHASEITAAQGADPGNNLTEAAQVTLGGSGLLPRWPEASLWIMLSIGTLLLAAGGVLGAQSSRLRIVFALFALPLLSVLIYRNAFPYFFPFAVPALTIAVAVGAQTLRGSLIWKLSLVMMLASGLIQTQLARNEGNTAQQRTIAEVHRLFPDAVPYIDQNGMIASFPRVGFFMSTWGIATYRAAAKPVFADLIARHHPPLLLANRNELYNAMRPEADGGQFIGLLGADQKALQNAYVHYSGAIWLAGKEAILTDRHATLHVPFAGAYRLETEAPLTINGNRLSSGAVITLDGSPLDIQGRAGTKLRLIWNTETTAPKKHLPETDLYAGFWRL